MKFARQFSTWIQFAPAVLLLAAAQVSAETNFFPIMPVREPIAPHDRGAQDCSGSSSALLRDRTPALPDEVARTMAAVKLCQSPVRREFHSRAADPLRD